MITESEHRRSYTERALDKTRDVLTDAQATYEINGQVISLANLIDNAIIADRDEDGIVTIPDEATESDALTVLALARNETLTIGKGLDSQSPAQQVASIDALKKWGMNDDGANNLLAFMASQLQTTRGTLSTKLGPQSEAATFSASAGFNVQRLAEVYGIPNPPTAAIGMVAARNTVIIPYGESIFPRPQVVAHELAHFVERTDSPIKTMASQRALDMRTLRNELKAYNAGAKVSTHIIRTSPLSQTELKLVVRDDTQLYIDYVRKILNQNDSDPFRATPEIVARLAKDGITLDDILHGRPNFDQMARTLEVS